MVAFKRPCAVKDRTTRALYSDFSSGALNKDTLMCRSKSAGLMIGMELSVHNAIDVPPK
jgi:hypothetical protein